mmetsp:Transcript_61372/g.121481  ORF Transcript_61372/g.121481 Transcript_61372/m.121481 type:complete len:956 (+) Transcript_61372:92-2959(+)
MGGHDWSQSDSEVVVKLAVDASTGKEQIKVRFESSRLSVWIAGRSVFAHELSTKVDPEECYWQLEGAGDARKLVIMLCKKRNGQWKALTKDEEEAMPKKDVLDEDFDVLNLEHDDDDPERVEEQEENERKLEARYKKFRAEKGLDNEDTLQTFFALFDNCIQLYRLNKLSDYLEEILPVCRKRNDKYKLKAIQAVAFVKWKQSKFREALPLFHEMEDILGKGAALCENIAHTYNSLGDYEKAEDYFRQALRFIEQEHGANQGNRGGVLLGLGLVRDRLGKHREALPVCRKAYEFYMDRANGAPASLQAKAGISCAKLHMKLGEMAKAEILIREAVHMYEVTCGETSPLTASAYHELGKCLWKQRKRSDAQKALQRAYEIESQKDAWDLVTLLEIHNMLMDTHLKETDHIERSRFQDYFKTVEYLAARVKRELPQDGNAAVYYKAAAELKAWGGRYEEAKELFNMAIPLFRTETSTDCTGLLQSCEDMMAFCNRNLEGKQNSPMDFEVPSKVAGEADPSSGQAAEEEEEEEEEEGVKIEEIIDEEEVQTAMVAPSSSPAEKPASHCYRAALPGDGPLLVRLCKVCGLESLLTGEAVFDRHICGPGAGLCWAAERPDGELSGFALCGSDGVFGQVLQLAVAPIEDADRLRHDLIRQCVGACRLQGLRSLRMVALSEADSQIAAALGGSECHRVYELLSSDGKTGAADEAALRDAPPRTGAVAATSSSSAAGASEAHAKLKRDDKKLDSYYNAWDKVNVDKALIVEDGGDPSVVPEDVGSIEAFAEFGVLDATAKISSFAWDQSDKFVSIYVPFEGAGALPEGAVECHFQPHGVLLLVSKAQKQHWFKVPNLCREIDIKASKKTVKTDQVAIKLKKLEASVQWSDLNDEKDKYQKRREYRINHGDLKGATTEELLADMYKHASDEDRAGLRDAMRVNREKRAEDAKIATEEAKRARAS